MSNYAEIWNQIERSRYKPVPFKDELTTPQFTGEPSMTDKEQAVQMAVNSGAVKAWLCGQDIQWCVLLIYTVRGRTLTEGLLLTSLH